MSIFRSCWLELSELCVTEMLSPPVWQQLDPNFSTNSNNNNNNNMKNNEKNPTKNSKNTLQKNANNSKPVGQESRVIYLCFLAHYYLELQQGEKAIKVLEGVLHIFPNSHIATSQVSIMLSVAIIAVFSTFLSLSIS